MGNNIDEEDRLNLWRWKNSFEVIKYAVRRVLLSPYIARLIYKPFSRLLGRNSKDKTLDMSQVKRILVIRLDEIGDVILTSPFIRELRRLAPHAWITMITKPSVYNLMKSCPDINEVQTYDCNVLKLISPLQRHWRAFKFAFRHLWHRHFDLAIVPRWDTDDHHAAFLAYLSGAPWRIGYSENVNEKKGQYNRGYDSLFTHSLNDRILKHEVERNLGFIEYLGGKVLDHHLVTWESQEDELFADCILAEHEVYSNDLLIALAPGAGSARRMWSLTGFIELGNWLIKELGARLIVIGGPGEEILGRKMRMYISRTVINCIGQSTLSQTCALLKRCNLFIGNDSGPMHMAAAAGLPVIEISCHPRNGSPVHLNSPRRFGPWGVIHRVIQPNKGLPPCSAACIAKHAHCISTIMPEQVRIAVTSLLPHLEKFGRREAA